MTSFTQQQKVETPQGGGVEKKEGLAPIARMILEKGFRNPEFGKFYDSIRERCNLVYSGKATPVDVELLGKEIDAHAANVDKIYDAEVAEIMKNYLRKLKTTLRESAESAKV